MKKKKTVNYPVETGDAIIVIKEDGRIELCFGEEDLELPMTWPDQENYKTAVQFALMLDSFIKIHLNIWTDFLSDRLAS